MRPAVGAAPRPDPQEGQQASAQQNVCEMDPGQREVPHVEGVGARREAVGEFVEVLDRLGHTNIRPVSTPPKRYRGTLSMRSRLRAWIARATDQELVSRISVSIPPRFMFSVCREASNRAGSLSRSCMNVRNRIAKMTESAPMKTQTPSTPGRRLGFTRSVVTTTTHAYESLKRPAAASSAWSRGMALMMK